MAHGTAGACFLQGQWLDCRSLHFGFGKLLFEAFRKAKMLPSKLNSILDDEI